MSEELNIRSYYYHCGNGWTEDWSCACNAQCPECGTKDIEPYFDYDVIQSEAMWDKLYKPIMNSFTDEVRYTTFSGGEMFETYGPEHDEIVRRWVDPDLKYTVWTLVETDNITEIVPGYHYVNRMGYFITEVPFNKDYDPEPFIWDVEPPEELKQEEHADI